MAQTGIFTSARAALEATRGTALNPTRVLEMSELTHEPSVALIRPLQIGSYFGRRSASAGREMHSVTLTGTALTYNQLAWLGNLFVKAVTTGTGAGADKTYAFVPSGTADDVKSVTLEWGYDLTLSATSPGWRLPYVVGDELTITWDKTNLEGVAWSAKLHSPKAATNISAFGGSPTTIASTPISPVETQVYIDAATIGTTTDDYVQKAELSIPIVWADLDTLNQTTAAQDTFRAAEKSPTLTLTRYLINDNELDRYHDKAERKIRVESIGPVLGGSNYEATLDFYGVLDTDGWRVAEVDGLKFETLKYVNLYDTTASTDHSLTVVTAETTIT